VFPTPRFSQRYLSGSAFVRSDAGKAGESLEERLRKLELKVQSQESKIAEVEKMAKRKGAMMTMVMEYGAPIALWYGTVWLSMWLGLYGLLELGVVNWQESLRPLFVGMGLEAHIERIDPSMGHAVIAFLLNECLEPVRFPLVVATGAPVIKALRRLRAERKAAGAAGAAGASGTAGSA